MTERASVLELYADGILDMEIIGGGNVRMTYFTWMRGDRVPVASIVRPMESFYGDMAVRVRAAKHAQSQQEAAPLN